MDSKQTRTRKYIVTIQRSNNRRYVQGRRSKGGYTLTLADTEGRPTRHLAHQYTEGRARKVARKLEDTHRHQIQAGLMAVTVDPA